MSALEITIIVALLVIAAGGIAIVAVRKSQIARHYRDASEKQEHIIDYIFARYFRALRPWEAVAVVVGGVVLMIFSIKWGWRW